MDFATRDDHRWQFSAIPIENVKRQAHVRVAQWVRHGAPCQRLCANILGSSPTFYDNGPDDPSYHTDRSLHNEYLSPNGRQSCFCLEYQHRAHPRIFKTNLQTNRSSRSSHYHGLVHITYMQEDNRCRSSVLRRGHKIIGFGVAALT